LSFGEVEDYTIKIGDNNQPPNLMINSAHGTNEVSFANTTDDGRIASWNWRFGDGQSSTDASPTHAYAESGNYSVSLQALDSDGLLLATWDQVVAFNTTTTPVITEVIDGLNVVFDGQGSAQPVGSTVFWNFGNGQTASNIGPVSIDYYATGSYNVSLTITNPDNPTGVTQNVTVDVVDESYQPDFSAVATDLTVALNNTSTTPLDLSTTNTDATLIWDFGDGSAQQQVTSADFGADNSYTYSTAGTYDVSLWVKYFDAQDNLVTTAPVVQSVTVTDPAPTVNYCSATGFTDYEFIASVNFNNFGDMSNDNSGVLSVVNAGNPIEMTVGQNISYTITGGFDSWGPYEENYHVWIDFNGDGEFGDGDWRNDTSERVVAQFDANATGVVTGTFTLPANKFSTGTTNTRMRILQYYSFSATNSVDPCSEYTVFGDGGEIEDYEVSIIKN